MFYDLNSSKLPTTAVAFLKFIIVSMRKKSERSGAGYGDCVAVNCKRPNVTNCLR
jgi:hypothetical protein